MRVGEFRPEQAIVLHINALPGQFNSNDQPQSTEKNFGFKLGSGCAIVFPSFQLGRATGRALGGGGGSVTYRQVLSVESICPGARPAV